MKHLLLLLMICGIATISIGEWRVRIDAAGSIISNGGGRRTWVRGFTNRSVDTVIYAGQSNAENRNPNGSTLGSELSWAQTNVFYVYASFSVRFSNQYDGSYCTYMEPTPAHVNQTKYFGMPHTMADGITGDEGTRGGTEAFVYQCAKGATSLAVDWGKGNTNGSEMYAFLTNTWHSATNAAFTKYSVIPRIKAFVWMQGESDAMTQALANAYRANLSNFILDVRSDFGTNMQFIVCRISDDLPVGTFPHAETVRVAQVAITGDLLGVSWVDLDSCSMDDDDTHFDADGAYSAGYLIATSYVENVN